MTKQVPCRPQRSESAQVLRRGRGAVAVANPVYDDARGGEAHYETRNHQSQQRNVRSVHRDTRSVIAAPPLVAWVVQLALVPDRQEPNLVAPG